MAEYSRIQMRPGVYLAKRYVRLLQEVSDTLGLDLTQRIIQGSYHPGVGQSGGTHDRGGAADIHIADLSDSQIWRVLTALRKYCAAWHRTPDQGAWNEHVHSIDVGAFDLAPAAQSQVTMYYQGYNGLTGSDPDDGPKVKTHPYDYQEGLMAHLDAEDKKYLEGPFTDKLIRKLMDHPMKQTDWADDQIDPSTKKPYANIDGKPFEGVVGNLTTLVNRGFDQS